MQYHFDQEIDRSGTNATKWEFVQSEEDVFRLERTDRFFGQDRALPMWVADMDFVSPRPVIEALAARVAHGIFGYSSPGETYLQAIVDWMRRRQGWDVSADSIVVTPGVVPALCMLVQTFTRPGDSVLIQPPVYHPFSAAIERNGAQVVRNSLVLEGGRYRMDFDDLEKKAADPRVKMAILCSPHNPVGRVSERDELKRFAEICLEHEVLIVSDEIHGDLIFPGTRLHPPRGAGRGDPRQVDHLQRAEQDVQSGRTSHLQSHPSQQGVAVPLRGDAATQWLERGQSHGFGGPRSCLCPRGGLARSGAALSAR